MTATILNGSTLADTIKKRLATKIAAIRESSGQVPGLAYLLADEGPVSKHYVAGKSKACQAVGMTSFVEPFPPDIPEEKLLRRIDELNVRADVHGILVQFPLPTQVNLHHVVERIDPQKDVDGFHPYNRGLLFSSHTAIVPCTPKGIITLLKENKISMEGKRTVILGRSLVVGRPLLMLFLNENATVTVCHQKTRDLESITKTAEILVAAVGRPKFVKKKHVAPGAVVIDVGVHQVAGKLVGDVDFDEVATVAKAITPVPGGVGPMTVATLLENTFDAFQKSMMSRGKLERVPPRADR